MRLQETQEHFRDIIKRRMKPEEITSDYFVEIAKSRNLQLVQKIAQWWRIIQIESFSVLTGRYLLSINMLQPHIEDFLRTEKYSAFRNEVGFQFLHYLIKADPDEMTTNLAEFELNLIGQRLGYNVQYSKTWEREPFGFLEQLLKNEYDPSVEPAKGRYVVTVSSAFKDEVFKIKKLRTNKSRNAGALQQQPGAQ